MANNKLDAIPNVDIEDSGRFKYILLKVYGKEEADGTEPAKLIVRGYQRAQWHGRIFSSSIDISILQRIYISIILFNI